MNYAPRSVLIKTNVLSKSLEISRMCGEFPLILPNLVVFGYENDDKPWLGCVI